jgi:lipoate---protein ligase
MLVHLLHTKELDIFDQLQLEEALLRCDNNNWCIINEGTKRKAIVLGISGKKEQLISPSSLSTNDIAVIKRFSGGGCVVVDQNTLFVTFIFGKNTIPIKPYPESILQWSYNIYNKAFTIPNFHLKENDFVINNTKCGGNALYIKKDRWLIHSSFLWDYSDKNMDHLLLPEKKPEYRQNRPHADFLCRLKPYYKDKSHLTESLTSILEKKFKVKKMEMKDVAKITNNDHRQSTCYI